MRHTLHDYRTGDFIRVIRPYEVVSYLSQVSTLDGPGPVPGGGFGHHSPVYVELDYGDDDIRELLGEAQRAGDVGLAHMCKAALKGGDGYSLRECYLTMAQWHAETHQFDLILEQWDEEGDGLIGEPELVSTHDTREACEAAAEKEARDYDSDRIVLNVCPVDDAPVARLNAVTGWM